MWFTQYHHHVHIQYKDDFSTDHLILGWMDASLPAKKWSQYTTFPKTTDCGLYISIYWLN